MKAIRSLPGVPSLARHFSSGASAQRLALSAVAAALLAASVVFALHEASALRDSQSAYVDAVARAEAARSSKGAQARAQDALLATQKFVRDANAAGLAAENWDERKFSLKQVSMGREAVNALMTEVEQTPDQIFSAEHFDIAVKSPDEGLFTPPAGADAELVVSLRGTLHFRVGGGPK